jgi:hypothetical protein
MKKKELLIHLSCDFFDGRVKRCVAKKKNKERTRERMKE